MRRGERAGGVDGTITAGVIGENGGGMPDNGERERRAIRSRRTRDRRQG